MSLTPAQRRANRLGLANIRRQHRIEELEGQLLEAAVDWRQNGADVGTCSKSDCPMCALSRAVDALLKAKKKGTK